MNKEQLERKVAKANYKLSKKTNPIKHQEERDALTMHLIRADIPNWNIKFNIL